MFTGIVELKGKIVSFETVGSARRLGVDLYSAAEDVKVGDSIAIEGACLTAVGREGTTCFFDVVSETLATTTLGSKRVGDEVNVERPLKVSDRLGGHLLSGHVDGIGHITDITRTAAGHLMQVEVPEELAELMIEKGSVAVDGVSLTITESGGNWFKVALIPHTLAQTTLGQKRVGDALNIETDMIGKWVKRIVERQSGKAVGITMEDLKKAGFP